MPESKTALLTPDDFLAFRSQLPQGMWLKKKKNETKKNLSEKHAQDNAMCSIKSEIYLLHPILKMETINTRK